MSNNPPMRSNEILSKEQETRIKLALAYRIIAKLGMDDLTYTHISARLPSSDNYFIMPFGLLFSEVTASSLLKVNLEGEVLEGKEQQYNTTGYVIHSAIYKTRSDINAIIHLHTIAGVALSALVDGLLPISQFSFHFHNRLSYYDYNSLALDHQVHGRDLAAALGKNKAMILRNHGTLCAGTSIQEAFFYTYYLEQACKTQLAACGTGLELIKPEPFILERAADDMSNFEHDLGARDWLALKRLIDSEGQDYIY